MLAYYLHNLSPHVIRFTDTVAIHWYGLAYVMGFYCCFLIMRSLARRGYGELKPDQVGDFITLVALFGVVLGGRVGYMLMYNLDELIHNPGSIVTLWKGGMASHGGILGIVIFTFWYARRHKISWPGLGDNLVVGAPIGLFFGRLANFINGELFGRITDVSWAMKFPTEIHQLGVSPASFGIEVPGNGFPQHSNEIVALVNTVPDGLAQLEAALHPRHPSQLYEAALEGALLFTLLYLVRTRVKNLPVGMLSGLFFVIYAVARIIVENYREPDSSLIMGITKGQFYSTFMIGTGLAFILWSMTVGRKERRV